MSRRILIIVVFLAGLLGFGAWTVLLRPSDLPPDGFSRGNGRIEADLIDVSPKLAGRVAEIRVREGDLVKAGDVLAVMDTAELRAQLARADAAVASAEASVGVAAAQVHLPDHPRLTFQELIVPMQNDSGARLGGIHLLVRADSEPVGHLLPALQSLAAQIASALHRAEVYAQQIASEKMARELEVAGRIQASFLPRTVPQIEGWEIAAALIPARQTSGDFYDFVSLDRGRVALVVADVADKGTGAALYMALSRTLLRTYASQFPDDPAQVLRASNERLFTDTESDQFVTVFYGVLDPAEGTLTYANAGHNPALILNNGTRQELGQTGIPLGMFEGMAWQTKCVSLKQGDLLVIYSDGVSEAQDSRNAEFGMERLVAAAHTDHAPLSHVQAQIITTINQFVGSAPQFDDMTLVLVRPR